MRGSRRWPSRQPHQRRARHRRAGRAPWNRERGRPHAAGRGRNRAEPFLVAGISDRQTGPRRRIREIAFAQGHRCDDAFGDHRDAGDAARRDCDVAGKKSHQAGADRAEWKSCGIVSRANLLQALAGMPAKNAAAASAGDSQIRDEVLSRLNAQLWRPSMRNVAVHDGAGDLWGFVTSDDEKKATRSAVERVPGVKTIDDHLTIPPPEIAMV